MPTRQQIHLVRHGETSNLRGIVYGKRDFGLTPLGWSQAETAGRYLSRTPGAVITSPVLRAKQTAQLVAEQSDYSLTLIDTDDRLTETTSIFDGARVPDVAAKASSWSRLLNPYRPSWNEEYAQVAARMQEAVTEALLLDYAHVVLVGHQLPIWIFRLALEGRPFAHDPASRQCGHASITTLNYRDKTLGSIDYWQNTARETVRSS